MNSKQTKDLLALFENMASLDIGKFEESFNSVEMIKAYRMRIQNIEVWNFRNIEYGKVSFPKQQARGYQRRNSINVGFIWPKWFG